MTIKFIRTPSFQYSFPSHDAGPLLPLDYPSHEDAFAFQPQRAADIPTWKKVLVVAKSTFEKIEKSFLKYLTLSAKILKSVLKVIVLAYSELEDKVNKVITYIGLIAIIKPFLNGYSLYKETLELEENIKLKDGEGIAWSLAEMIMKPCEIISSLLSIGSTFDKLVGIPWIVLFSAVTSPLAIIQILYDMITSAYKTIRISIELSKMPTSASDENYTDFRIYLEKKVGVTAQEKKEIEEQIQAKYSILSVKKEGFPATVTPSAITLFNAEAMLYSPLQEEAQKEFNHKIEVLKDRKINQLKRHTDKKVAEYMVRAHDYLEQNPAHQKCAVDALEDIRKLTVRKLILNSAETIFSITEAIMHVASMIFSALHIVSLAFSLAKTSFSVTKTIYGAQGMHRGLKNPEFLSEKTKIKTTPAHALS